MAQYVSVTADPAGCTAAGADAVLAGALVVTVGAWLLLVTTDSPLLASVALDVWALVAEDAGEVDDTTVVAAALVVAAVVATALVATVPPQAERTPTPAIPASTLANARNRRRSNRDGAACCPSVVRSEIGRTSVPLLWGQPIHELTPLDDSGAPRGETTSREIVRGATLNGFTRAHRCHAQQTIHPVRPSGKTNLPRGRLTVNALAVMQR